MNIVFACDDNYSPFLAVSILSILKVNKLVDFYILDLGISQRNKAKITEIVDSFCGYIHFININKEDFIDFPSNIPHISIATYARLKLDYYLPKNVKKVIYLDVDTLTVSPLEELWMIDLGEKAIGAVFDSFIEHDNSLYKFDIGLEKEHHYFNAGVLLVDVDKFREINVYQKSIDYLSIYPNIKYQDQDILNFIFRGGVEYINPRFNFMPTLKNKIKNKEHLLEYEQLTSPISIVHYCSSIKPWHKKCSHTQANLFITLFNAIPNKPRDWESAIEKPHFIIRFNRARKDIRDSIRHHIR